MRILGLIAALIAISMTTASPSTANAQTATQLPEGKYRGGINGVGPAYTMGAESCNAGFVADFSQNAGGQPQITFYRQVGTAFYEALKDGQPYAKENTMQSMGALPVVRAKDGTFAFQYSFKGDQYIYDQCTTPQPNTVKCFFHKLSGASNGWVSFYQR